LHPKKFDPSRKLKDWFSGARKVVLAGVGNPIRMDDFVGIRIIQLLQGRVSKNVLLIECETVPESFIQRIVDFNPTHVLLIDAAFLDASPGDSRLLKTEQLINHPAISTHTLPLKIFCDYVGKSTSSKISLLLIQPKETDFGEGLSREVETSAKKIAYNLAKVLPR
jgi:hydrogenase 3 maturation protease